MTSNKMQQQNSNPELTAQEVYQLVSEALQEHFQLDMTNRDYEAQDIFDMLIAACVEHISLAMGSNLLEDMPSGTELPYHSKYDDEDDTVRQGKAKSGTTHFFAFAILYVVKKHKRYTLAVVLMRRDEKAHEVVERLLKRGGNWACGSSGSTWIAALI